MGGVLALWLGLAAGGCAARSHVATPDEIERLREAAGLSTSGRLTLKGPEGRLSARVVIGVARPDSLRIEIPAGAGLRFLLVSRRGLLRADLPGDDAMYEGPATREVVQGLFGIDIEPADLVEAILGASKKALPSSWRFGALGPSKVTIHGPDSTKLTLTIDDSRLESPPDRAFEFGPPRRLVWSLLEMSSRLGLRR